MADADPLATLDDPRAGVGRAALDNPDAQEEFRDSPEFEELESEFRKMETGGPNAVKWKQLNEETVKVLQTTSKDLVLATRLVFGLFEEEGYPGLATGLVILRDMSETYWETMVPPVRRERGRAGAYDWLAEKLAPMVEARNPEGRFNREIYIANDALLELDTALEHKMTKSQVALGPLVRALRPYARDARAALEEERKAAEAAALPAQEPEEAPADGGDAEAAAPAPAADQAAPAPAPPAPQPAAAPAPPAPATEIAVDTSSAASAMQAVFNAATKAATAVRHQAPTDARGYYAARFALWGRIEALPPSTDGKTQLPPPQKTKISELAALKGAGNHEGLIASAESAFIASPFWLDAQFHLATAMQAAGDAYASAHRLVTGELACFLQRFPDLVSLTFSDGTAFASVETRDWIARELQAGGEGGGGGSSELDHVFSEACQLALGGKTTAGLATLKRYLSTRGSGRDWFQTQLKVGEFCLRFELIQPLFALLSSLRAIAAERDLAHWEPDLAVALARLSWQSLGHKNVKQFLPDAEALLIRTSVMETLSLLDVGAAAELTGRK